MKLKQTSTWLTIIGIGEDGVDGLKGPAQTALAQAAHLYGSARQLKLVPETDTPKAKRTPWQSPFAPHVDEVLKTEQAGTVILASGDPDFFGIAKMILKRIDKTKVTIYPAISSAALAMAQMGWSFDEVNLLSLCGRPLENLRPHLAKGQKLIILSADEKSPHHLADYLRQCGIKQAHFTCFSRLGGAYERKTTPTFQTLIDDDLKFHPLNLICAELLDNPDKPLINTAGLDDKLFEHDGQITKAEVRAITLAKLSPLPHLTLWDIGLGSGSIACEFLRLCPHSNVIGFEKNDKRALMAKKNAKNLGALNLEVIKGDINQTIKQAISSRARPQRIFIGGGLNDYAILTSLIEHLSDEGILVGNSVTLETEALYQKALEEIGGHLSKIDIAHAKPLGSKTSWQAQRSVTQWVYQKGDQT